MPSLYDSCLIKELPASVRQLAGEAQMSFPLSLRNFIATARCPHSLCVRLHFKFLLPTPFVNKMLMVMRVVYATADIGVSVASREDLTGPSFTMLLDPDFGNGVGETAEVTQLYSNRNHAAANDIVIYFVRTLRIFNGLASPHRPSAMIFYLCDGGTLAHEVGHILSLGHPRGETEADCVTPLGRFFGPCSEPVPRLMSTCGCRQPTRLTQEEIAKMRESPFTFNC